MQDKAPVYRIVIVQLIVTIVAAVFFLLIDKVQAYSVLFGGLTCVLPNFYMAWRIGRESANPDTALKYLVKGELGKLALTALMFSAVFVWIKPLDLAVFFAALVLIMLSNILVPLVEMRVEREKNSIE